MTTDYDDDDSWLEVTVSTTPETTSPNAAQPPEAEPPALRFASVYDFVEQHLIYTYARDVNKPGRQWCRQWWAHAEAMSRLESLWRAYEQLRLDPGTGMDVWWLDHADRQMAVLLDPEGPFDGCSAEFDRHDPATEVLPVALMEEDVLRQIMSGQLTEGN
ncbi:DUF4913 domain-containing protein [Nocardia sp. 348MFTsu5.1]|uniref:DUF4913 domain-containing protein n=1 Tax=Nocardia sp. 348MFTsu5.1 TaxID=1172185 RepID=UPI000363547E|nr:DUF4913 domain-containing protein [Nocardia sp. 348MFTsu5.1]